MISRALIVVLQLLVLSGAICGAQEEKASDVDQAAEIRQLIRQLESRDLEDRDEAEKKLTDLGGVILPHLPKVDARTSGEMKVRLERIRGAMQEEQEAVFFKASKVTLNGEMTLGEAFAALEEQTGNSIVLQGEGESKQVSLEAEDVEFWEAFAQLEEQVGLVINHGAMGGDGGLQVRAVQQVGDNYTRAFRSGPFRLEVATMRSTLPIGYGATMAGQLEVSLYLTWEPRLEPVFLRVPMASTKASAGDAELSPSNPGQVIDLQLSGYGGRSKSQLINLQVQRPARDAEVLESLTGQFSVAVPSNQQQFVFEKFANGARQTKKVGDVAVVLEGARRNGPKGSYEIRFRVQFGDAQGVLESFRGWAASNEAYLMDSKDVRFDSFADSVSGSTQNAFGVSYIFNIGDGNPDDFRLIYEAPATIQTQTVKFELKDIPLP